MGTNGFTEREGESMRAYRTYFSTYKTITLAKPGQTVVANVPVWHGSLGRTALTVPQPVQAFLQAAQQSAVKAEVTYQQPLLAPLAADTIAGELKLTLPSGQQLTAPLVPAQAVPQAGFFGRFFQTLGSKFGLHS